MSKLCRFCGGGALGSDLAEHEEHCLKRQEKCPVCHRMISLHYEKDGLAKPRFDRPMRFNEHSGNRFGRMCRHGGEQA